MEQDREQRYRGGIQSSITPAQLTVPASELQQLRVLGEITAEKIYNTERFISYSEVFQHLLGSAWGVGGGGGGGGT